MPCQPWARSCSCCRKGFETQNYQVRQMPRSMSVLKVTGATQIGDRAALIGGHAISLSCRAGNRCGTRLTSDDAVLFSYSDRPVQEKLGLWREERGNSLIPAITVKQLCDGITMQTCCKVAAVCIMWRHAGGRHVSIPMPFGFRWFDDLGRNSMIKKMLAAALARGCQRDCGD